MLFTTNAAKSGKEQMMINIIRLFTLAIMAMLMVACATVDSTGGSQIGKTDEGKPGEVRKHIPGKDFQISIRLPIDSPAVQAAWNKREDMSYLYIASRQGKKGESGFSFYEGGVVDIKVTGFTDTTDFDTKFFDVVSAWDRVIGTIKPSEVGKDYVVFKDVAVSGGAMGIVLKFGFPMDGTGSPTLTVTPKNFKFVGPSEFMDGESTSFDFTHRVVYGRKCRKDGPCIGVIGGGTVKAPDKMAQQ